MDEAKLTKLIDERIAEALDTLSKAALGNAGTKLTAGDLRYVASIVRGVVPPLKKE